MSTQTLLLIAGMMLVTYLPRALPAAFLEKIRPGARAKRFLEMIPYTAMAALIFPGILSADPQRWYVGLLGGGMAGQLSRRTGWPALVPLSPLVFYAAGQKSNLLNSTGRQQACCRPVLFLFALRRAFAAIAMPGAHAQTAGRGHQLAFGVVTALLSAFAAVLLF